MSTLVCRVVVVWWLQNVSNNCLCAFKMLFGFALLVFYKIIPDFDFYSYFYLLFFYQGPCFMEFFLFSHSFFVKFFSFWCGGVIFVLVF